MAGRASPKPFIERRTAIRRARTRGGELRFNVLGAFLHHISCIRIVDINM
jgi:hypothetical protein